MNGGGGMGNSIEKGLVVSLALHPQTSLDLMFVMIDPTDILLLGVLFEY